MIISDGLKEKKKKRIICCWQCKETKRTLYALRDENGKKTGDYSCEDHIMFGLPAIGNVSHIYE